MLISLKLQPNLLTLPDFALKHDSKDVAFTSKRANFSFHAVRKLEKMASFDFTLKRNDQDVDFTSKRANCSFHAARKLKNANLRPK